MCIVVKESYTWVYGGILNYNYLVGQFLEECREVQGFETLASIFQKTWEKQKNHMDSCGWARAEENQTVGQNVLLVPWVTQIPLLFWEGFRFQVSFPLFLIFSSELALFFFRIQNLLSTPGFLPCPQICTLTLSPNVFLNDPREVGHHVCGCSSGYQQDSLDSEVVGAAQHWCKPTLDTAASCNGGPLEE